MRIRNLYAAGFGHFADFNVSEIPDGLTILYGPNEAGKSTLMGLLVHVLFGRKRRTRDRIGALAGGQFGGRVTLEDQVGQLMIERLDNKLRVVRGGRPITTDDRELARILKVDRELFRAVFAFELADLASLDSLAPNGERDRLFAGALVGAGKSVARARSQLDDRCKSLWRLRAQSVIGDLEAELGRMHDTLHSAAQEAGEFLSLQRASDDFEARRRLYEEERRSLLEEACRWEAYQKAYEHFVELRDAKASLAMLPARSTVSLAMDERLNQLTQSRIIHNTRLESAKDLLNEAETAHEDSYPDRRKIEYARDIRQLHEDAAQVGRDSAKIFGDQRKAMEAKLGEALNEVGLSRENLPSWSVNDVAKLKRAATLAVEAENAQARVEKSRMEVVRAEEYVEQHVVRRDAVSRDTVAETLAQVVDELERGATRHIEAQARELELKDEIGAVEQELDGVGLELVSFAPNPAERERLARQLDEWRDKRNRARAGLDIADEQVDAGKTELANAQVAANRWVSSPSTTLDKALLVELEESFERACKAYVRAESLDASMAQAEIAMDNLLTGLGAWWSEERATNAQVEGTHRAVLTTRARALESAERALEEARTSLPEPADIPDYDPDALNARIIALSHADATFREYDELRARVQPAPPKSGVRTALFGLVLALLVLGGLGIAQGALLTGILVLILALALAAIAWTAFSGASGGEAPTDDVAARRKRVNEAFRDAGLPADATPATISKIKAELEAKRGEAERGADRARSARDAKLRFDAATTRRANEHDAWIQALHEAGFDPQMNPDALELVRNRVLEFQQSRHQRGLDNAERQTSIGVWNAFGARAQPLSDAVSQATKTPADARALMSKLRAWADDLDVLQSVTDKLEQAQKVRDEKQRAFDAIVAGREQLRATARSLGVPEDVDVEEAVRWLQRAERAIERRNYLVQLHREHTQCQDVRQTWERELASVIDQLGLIHSDMALIDARKHCASAQETLRKWQELEQNVTVARRFLDEKQRLLKDAEFEAARHDDSAWKESVRQYPALATVSASLFGVFFDAWTRARSADDELSKIELEAEEAERVWEALYKRADELASALDEPSPTPQALHEWILALNRQLEADERQLKVAENARTSRDNALREFNDEKRALDEVDAQISALLQECALPDVEAFKRALQVESRRQKLEATRDSARRTMQSVLGKWLDDEDTHLALQAGERAHWAVMAKQCHADATEREALVVEASEGRGEVNLKIKALEASATIADTELTITELQIQRDDARRTYLENAMASMLLDDAMSAFREKHQPSVLRIASADMKAATGGQYTSLRSSDDGQHLSVVDARGGDRTEAELSRGTTELLYIILRLALAADYAERDLRMPLVMDDILVNLDPERAEGVGKLLARVASRQQVIMLTCRPETRDLLQAHVPAARIINLERFAGRSQPVSSDIRSPASRTPRPTSSSVLSEEAEAILEVIKAASEPLGKAEILSQAELGSSDWKNAIKQLREQEYVTKHGTKRGATYAARWSDSNRSKRAFTTLHAEESY